jgi:ABC-type antimicrobial peptide transport system permease subunit
VRPVVRHGLARLLRDRTRTALVVAGVLAVAAMVGAAVTMVYALATAFDRSAAAAQMPDVTARFAERPLDAVAGRVAALTNVRTAAYRYAANGLTVTASDRFATAVVDGVSEGGPRGYALTAGHDIRGRDDVVIEAGLARSWHVHVGDRLGVGGASLRVAGLAATPGTVAYPLSHSPRLYVSYETAVRLAGGRHGVDEVLLWLNDPSRLDVTLAQARAASFGLSNLQFVTRSGYRHMIGRAAGLVIALLVAFSAIVLVAAGVMLGASAAAEIQRRREAIGVMRAFGAQPATVATGYAVESAVVAAPAAAVGLVVGSLVVGPPLRRLLAILNELAPPPGTSVGLLAAAWAAIVAVVAAATWLPAWRAARERVVDSLRGGDVVQTPRRVPFPTLAGFGARLTLARPARAVTLVAVLAASTAVVLLMLAIADVLGGLQRNAQTLGTRYQLTVPASGISLADVRRVPGVAAATFRYQTEATDSFALGESFTLVGFSGDVTSYEAPPLAAGRRVRGVAEAEVGRGLAQALDLHAGATLAAQLPSGRELRFRVVGIVDSLRDEGLVAYVRAPRLRAAMPAAPPEIAIKLAGDSSLDDVRNALLRRGVYAEKTGGISADSGLGTSGRASFLHVLAALLRSVAFLDGLVCVYALAQILALIARERRRAVAVIRALGASRAQVFTVLAGAAVLLAVLALPIGIVVERTLLGPAVAHLAVSYVTLSLAAGRNAVAAVAAGLAFAAAIAAGWATRSATAGEIVVPLREE